MLSWTNLHRLLPLALTLTSSLIAAHKLDAQLFADPQTSNPSNGQGLTTGTAPVPREMGKKGLVYRFKFLQGGNPESNAGFPLNMTAAQVMVTFGTTSETCLATATPAANKCGYTLVDGPDNDGVDDAVRIIFNADFPPATEVTYRVTGAKDNFGNVQDPNTSPDVDVTFKTGTLPPAPPRSPGSTELVFDISGSMDMPAVPAVPGSDLKRLRVLKDAAALFFLLLPDYRITGDKLGVVYFSTTATAYDLTPGGTNLELATDNGKVGLLNTSIQNQNPTYSTSIGGGLSVANTAGFAADPTPNQRKGVLLFSDGEQNKPPCVGNLTTAPCNGTLGSSPLRLNGVPYPADITVCPVTAGQQSAPGFVLQREIGQFGNCPNIHLHISDGAENLALADMKSFFAEFFTTAFSGDKLEIARDVVDTVPRLGSSTEPFFASAHDVAMSIVLSWSGTKIRRLPFSLKAPNGALIDLTKFLRSSQNLRVATLPLPLVQNGVRIDPKGQWEVTVIDSLGQSDAGYHLMVLLDNMTIASEFRSAGHDLGTGEPIPIQVKLTEGGAPVLGAIAAAQLQGPQNGMGNILSTTPTPPGTPNPGGDQFTSEAAQKLSLILSDTAHAGLFRDKGFPTLPLLDNGQQSNGDSVANDGIYTGLFRGATQEGHYHFAVAAQGTTPTNGDFQRTWKLVTFVRPKPSAGNTEVSVVSSTSQANGGEIDVLKAVPKDNLGNYVGPGYIGYLDIAIPAPATVVTPLKDKLDGSYEVSYKLPPTNLNPPVTLTVMGDTVVSKSLDDIKVSLPRRVVSLHAGVTVPHSNLANAFNSSISLGADFEYRFTQRWSAEAYLGYDRFSAQGAGDALSLVHISALGKATFGAGKLRPAVDAGIGAYFAGGAGSGTHFGWTVGAGAQYWWRPKFAVEGSYHYRNAKGGDYVYSTIQGGVRIGF